ncbi:hypothetical protein C8F04DRAFT_593751 [Mycena alexandri]|uniref:F-box domain-containing protein n=1 Tax=Mycena alexandri TaxID=1745969 RepID=A0AAD6XCB0_9AGAR|nr:hypothetical protein C8F04DRAFT_593751 [Mycena alexandri]
MATLDAERTHAANLDIQISALRAERTLIQERLDSYKYPVLTLPNEIISEIFIRFVPVYPEGPSLYGIHSPTNLTHICRKWRDIALATPELWRAVQLSVGDASDIPLGRQLQELDAWLSRSRSCPFSIEVSSSSSIYFAERNFVFSPARAARWEHLKASFQTSRSFIIEAPMPLLRHLDLTFDYAEVDPHPIVFGEAPLLRSVVLNDFAALEVILPWVQLTSLTLTCIHPHECVPVLKQTPNLVYCKLHLYDHPPTAWPDVTLPRLESLTLVPYTPGHKSQTRYLETFIVPALCKLHIKETILENPIDTLTSFMLKSGCSPQEIHISGERRVSRDAYSRAFQSVKLSFDVGQETDIASNTESDSESL